ncbi:hypothetical protein AMTRI_Chr10g231920 [Amborella trichopoda]
MELLILTTLLFTLSTLIPICSSNHLEVPSSPLHGPPLSAMSKLSRKLRAGDLAVVEECVQTSCKITGQGIDHFSSDTSKEMTTLLPTPLPPPLPNQQQEEVQPFNEDYSSPSSHPPINN